MPLFVCSIDDEPPGEHKGGGDFANNVAESVTTINSSDDGIDDGEIHFQFSSYNKYVL